MKKFILLFAILITSQIAYGQTNKLVFASELDFINSWYGSDAILKFRATINSRLVTPCEECEKLKGINDFKNPQQALYKKYESLLKIFDKSYCIVPYYFLKQKDGTYTYMINFIEIGMRVPESYAPIDVFHALYKKIEPLVYALSFISNSIKGNEISRIQLSVCYRVANEYIDSPNILAFSTSRLNIDNYHNGKITESQFFSKVRVYHTEGADFKKIQ
jgi:hypothetical protein